MVEARPPCSHRERINPLFEALDEEVADLEVVVDWLRDQVDDLRWVVNTLLQELVWRDDAEAASTTPVVGRWTDWLDEPISQESTNWRPSGRRATRYSRPELLRMVAEQDVNRPGIRQWPRHLLLLALRQEGVIGNARIVR
jgi:hypothetical protein